MKATTLVLRGLTYYWRTNVAVVAGVATAVAVLAGALLVGDSVRGSLRDLVLQRLARAERESGVLLRDQRESAINRKHLRARQDGLGREMRLAVRALVGQVDLGEYS